MTWPEPTRDRHEQFCKAEGWQQVRDARGRTGTHHVTYEFGLPDGRILRTRISHPVDRTGYGAALWSHILRDQLDVTEETFWQCVLEHVVPNRGIPEPPRESLPADVVHLLIHRVGIGADVIAAMSKDQAIARLQRFWTEGS
ncbi:cytotoxic translational repressor of toxin-antitoxin stability system [Nocardia sp. NBC_00881]|uniref:cytotoxic translational repressor of toxin-antitoxin stability system n=1 Tax=Nocardia sp. NBC_00881 TaxID=2975995 RepID=UPI003870DAFF|nr:cytotoxic translational repressor of toxin-antitoxin stability system [Nocardia sp. NBC_00881]